MPVIRSHIVFFSLIAMLLGLFISRAMLSASAAVLVAACCLHGLWRDQVNRFFGSPLLWSMSLLFILPLLSGLWAGDRAEWLNVLRIKLPLLLLPLSFASPFSLSRQQWKWLAMIFIGIVMAATLWTTVQYLRDTQGVHEAYLRAGAMRTPLDNDHVRFGWLVAICALFSAGWAVSGGPRRRLIAVPGLVALWLIVFLHILAVRTGLLCLYTGGGIAAIWALLHLKDKGIKFSIVIALLALPVLAWILFPTFRNKVRFFRYDYGFVRQQQYLPGGNDATRVLSLRAGRAVMFDHPVCGTGFGDVLNDARRWYEHHYPEMKENERILPSSEWLVYGGALGFPGFFLFTLIVALPVCLRVPSGWRWRTWALLGVISLLFDVSLEVQFGVFIYCLALLAPWKYLVSFKSEGRA